MLTLAAYGLLGSFLAWPIHGPCWHANTHFTQQATQPTWMLPVWSKTKSGKLSQILN